MAKRKIGQWKICRCNVLMNCNKLSDNNKNGCLKGGRTFQVILKFSFYRICTKFLLTLRKKSL